VRPLAVLRPPYSSRNKSWLLIFDSLTARVRNPII